MNFLKKEIANNNDNDNNNNNEWAQACLRCRGAGSWLRFIKNAT